MIKKQHKVISLVLCLMLVFSAVIVGAVAAAAASGDTVYVRANNGWTNLYCYMWDDSIGSNASWPGVKMTEVEDGVYSYTLTDDYTMVIFNNNGNGSSQTSDLTYPGDGKIYDLSAGTWSTYASTATTAAAEATTVAATTAAATESTTAAATEATTATTPSSSATVYLENEAGWSTPYCYMWNSSSDANATWPGEAMTSVGDNIWSYTPSSEYANVIFSNSGSSQTADLTANYGYVYNNSDSTWTVYDTSPLQVVSYSCNPTAVYVNADVEVAAEAQNTSGATVNYKFSVTDSSGTTTVLSGYSSVNSVTWTPAATGTYTLTFDFADSDGNTNERTLSVEVIDDSSMTKPVIKSVLPFSGGLVAVDSSVTVNVKAGGGNTGTNLLFYKYIVTDPDGNKNTPYYTLGSSYSFTPSSEGEYTVQVYVQGSDNSTVTKTYTYTAVGEINTTAPVTIPSTTTSSVLLGDANGDGELTVDDATYIQMYLASYSGYDCTTDVCDMTGDGDINIIDVTKIQMTIAGIA